jgi:hypothetical protein
MADIVYNKEWNILQRLAEVQRNIGYIQKVQPKGRGDDKGLKYSIVTHDAVTGNVRPKMVAAGVLYYPYQITIVGQKEFTIKTSYGTRLEHRCEVHLICRFVSVDDKNDFIDVHGIGHGVDTGDKGPGKAVSYAVKYCLLKALGLETGDADESEFDQEERTVDPPEEVKIKDFEEKVAMSTTSHALRVIAEAFKDDMTKFAEDKKWKARVKQAQVHWQARMAQVKKAEAAAGEDNEEEEIDMPGDNDRTAGKPRISTGESRGEEEEEDTTGEDGDQSGTHTGSRRKDGKSRSKYEPRKDGDYSGKRSKPHPASGD